MFGFDQDTGERGSPAISVYTLRIRTCDTNDFRSLPASPEDRSLVSVEMASVLNQVGFPTTWFICKYADMRRIDKQTQQTRIHKVDDPSWSSVDLTSSEKESVKDQESDRVTRVKMRQFQPVLRHLVQVRRHDDGVAVKAHIAVAQVIRHHQNDIGLGALSIEPGIRET